MRSDFDELKRFAIADILSVSGRQKTTETADMHINTIIDIAFLKGQQESKSKVDELQKRVDDLELTIKGAVSFVDLQIEATEQGREAAIGTQAKNWWSSKLLMLRPIRRVLEQALKGGSDE